MINIFSRYTSALYKPIASKSGTVMNECQHWHSYVRRIKSQITIISGGKRKSPFELTHECGEKKKSTVISIRCALRLRAADERETWRNWRLLIRAAQVEFLTRTLQSIVAGYATSVCKSGRCCVFWTEQPLLLYQQRVPWHYRFPPPTI